MKTDLKTPCKDCPYKRGGLDSLRPERVRELVSYAKDGKTFQCHKTNNVANALNRQVCAGMMIMAEKLNGEVGCINNQYLRINNRLGLFDPDKLQVETSDVYDSAEEMLEGHKHG